MFCTHSHIHKNTSHSQTQISGCIMMFRGTILGTLSAMLSLSCRNLVASARQSSRSLWSAYPPTSSVTILHDRMLLAVSGEVSITAPSTHTPSRQVSCYNGIKRSTVSHSCSIRQAIPTQSSAAIKRGSMLPEVSGVVGIVAPPALTFTILSEPCD